MASCVNRSGEYIVTTPSDEGSGVMLIFRQWGLVMDHSLPNRRIRNWTSGGRVSSTTQEIRQTAAQGETYCLYEYWPMYSERVYQPCWTKVQGGFRKLSDGTRNVTYVCI